MKPINEQLEHLIVRSLDGELTEDEQLALDRELIRNPEARVLMDEYRSVDSACLDAMSSWLDARDDPSHAREDAVREVQSLKIEVQREGRRANAEDRSKEPIENWQLDIGNRQFSKIDNRQSTIDHSHRIDNRLSHRRHHLRQLLIIIPGAIAAALLAIVFPWPAKNPNGDALLNHSSKNGFVDEAFSKQRPSVIPNSMKGTSMNGTPIRNAAWSNPATFRGRGREVIGIMGDDGNIYWIEVERTRTIERAPSPLPADKLNQL